MTSKVMCPMCQARVSADGLLCQGPESCTTRVQTALAGVRVLHDAALTTYTRQARIGPGGGRRSHEQPLPFDPRVTPLLREVGAAVDVLARMADVADLDHRMTVRATLAAKRVSTRLRARVGEDDLAWFRSLTFSVARLELVVDAPDVGQYVGQCNKIVGPAGAAPVVCGADLYAKAAAAFVTCVRCGQQWPVAERRAVLLAAVDDQVVTATVVAKSLTSLGDVVSAERIRQWAHRNRLIPVSRDAQGHPLYRISDVRQLLREDEERRAVRRSRAASR